jgi:hypothetical protein
VKRELCNGGIDGVDLEKKYYYYYGGNEIIRNLLYFFIKSRIKNH